MINAERVTVQQVYRGTSTIGIINSFNKGKYKTKIYRPQEVSCFYARESNILLIVTCNFVIPEELQSRLNEPLGTVDGYLNLFLRVVFLDRKIKLCLIKYRNRVQSCAF